MKIAKKASGKWIKPGVDLGDQATVTILNEGIVQDGEYGPQTVFDVRTIKNAEFIISFNQSSLNNLIDAFGDDTKEWIGKVVKAWVVKQMIGGNMKNVAYFAPPDWTMDDNGKFHPLSLDTETEPIGEPPF